MNEAIHNLINQKIFNGEIKKYRLPRMLRILAMTKEGWCATTSTKSRNDEVEALK